MTENYSKTIINHLDKDKLIDTKNVGSEGLPAFSAAQQAGEAMKGAIIDTNDSALAVPVQKNERGRGQ
jgi:hypothetical protein